MNFKFPKTDADDRERLRARESFVFGSSLQLGFSTLPEEGTDNSEKRLEVLTKQIILPFIGYGTVLISDLNLVNSDPEAPESFLADLAYAAKAGVCRDLNDVFSPKELDEANRRVFKHTNPAIVSFNAAFNEAGFQHCATVAESLARGEYTGSDSNQRLIVWRQAMQRASDMIGLRSHDGRAPPPELRNLSDDELSLRLLRGQNKCMLFQLESERLHLVALGKQPTVPQLNVEDSTSSKGDKARLLEIVLPRIALPKLQTTKDLIDFVTQEEYRIPMKRLREHCAKLAQNSESLIEATEAIEDDLAELDRAISKEKLSRYFGSCKFIFGAAAGIAEDVIKVRLESLVKRPFEIAEKISEQYYYGPQYKKEPLYFLWALHDRFGEG